MELTLNRELNHKYYNLIDMLEALEDSYHELNRSINSYPSVKVSFPLFKNEKAEKDFAKFEEKFHIYENMVDEFLNLKKEFLGKSNYVFGDIEENVKELIFINCSNQLQNGVDTVRRNIDILSHNITQIVSDYENGKNFIIAMFSWKVTLFSLIVSIIGLIYSLFH